MNLALCLLICRGNSKPAKFGGRKPKLDAPHSLKVNGLLPAVAVISDPLPRFSFLYAELGEGAVGVTQASYRIAVSKIDSAALVWDSGSVNSANCSEIVYEGLPLTAFTRYEWTAEWTASGDVGSSNAATASFETGPMATKDWHNAAWLQSQNTQYRREFVLPSTASIVWARAYVAAAGCAHIEINGAVPQPNLMGICPWSVTPNLAIAPSSSLNVQYVTHNITGLLKVSSEQRIYTFVFIFYLLCCL